MSARAYWIAGATLLLVAGAIAYWLIPTPTEVESTEVQRREVVEIYVATGRVAVPRTSELGADLPGDVRRVAVSEGADLEKGDPIVELRPRDAEMAVEEARARAETFRQELRELERGATDAQIREARAEVDQTASRLAEAERALERTEALFERDAVTEEKVDRARSSVEQATAGLDRAEARLERLRERPLPEKLGAARARLRRARIDLERARDDVAETVVRAPFDGLVLEVYTDEGERVAPDDPVARMADLSSAEIYAEVDEDFVGRLEPGDPATLIFPSMPERSFSATIDRVGPEVQTDRGVVGVHLEPESLPDGALPGLTVDANIEVARLEDALAAPTDAVVRGRDGTYVLTAVEGEAVRRAVDIRARGDRWMAIEGIDEGTELLRDAARLEAGRAIAPVQESEP